MQLVAFDYETALLDGTPSVEFYRDDFRVVSAAFQWSNGDSDFCVGEEDVRAYLNRIQQCPVIVHNFAFEYGVTKYRFPELALNWHADTMRLVQVWDNGGRKAQAVQYEKTLDELLGCGDDDDEKAAKIPTGLGLQASAARVLPESYHNHKEPYHSYLRETHQVKKGSEGSNLHLLTPALLEAYNISDVVVTMALYTTLIERFKRLGYDWRLDHQLYLSSARMIAESTGRGVMVNLGALRGSIAAMTVQVAEVSDQFRDRFRDELEALEARNLERLVNARKTERGRANALTNALKHGTHLFNLNSGKQKAELFMVLLGITPVFFTKKGAPAFGKAFLKQWGEGGIMLEKRGTMLIGLKQMVSLEALSSLDGRWHLSIRAAAAATGRMSGGR